LTDSIKQSASLMLLCLFMQLRTLSG